jgi:hypothetical protein
MRQMKPFILFLICAAIAGTASSQPLALHPANPHYFIFKGQPLALITSAEHYGAVLNPDFDYIKYLNTLKNEGMNYTRIFTGSYFERAGSFGIEKNTLAPAPGKALVPWKRSNEPGALCGGNKFDLERWDDSYFERLASFVAAAAERDIIVEITLFSSIYGYWDIQPFNPSNNINIKTPLKKEQVQTTENEIVIGYHERFVRKIVREMASFDNIFYEIQNEPWSDHPVKYELNREFMDNADFRLDGHEWQKKIEIAGKKSLEWQQKIASVISDEERSTGRKHLIAQNYANFYYPVDEVDPNVSILNFHYAYPIAVDLNYHHNRVVGFDESGFAGSEDITYRKQAWKFIMAGGGLFNSLDYSFAVGYEDGTAVNKAPGGGSSQLRKQLNILSDFIHSLDFVRMKPDTSTIVKSDGARVRMLSEIGKSYAAYVYNGTGCRLTLDIPSGKYNFDWTDTRDGSVSGKGRIKHRGGELLLESPAFNDDIALKIIKSK